MTTHHSLTATLPAENVLFKHMDDVLGPLGHAYVKNGPFSFSYHFKALNLAQKAPQISDIDSFTGHDLFMPLTLLHVLSKNASEIAEVPRALIEIITTLTIANSCQQWMHKAKTRTQEKKVETASRLSAALTVGSAVLLNQLADHNLIQGVATAPCLHILSPLTAALNFYEAYQAHRKAELAFQKTDGVYLLYDRLQKIEAAQKKLKLVQDEADEAQQVRCEKIVKRLSLQIQALYATYHDDIIICLNAKADKYTHHLTPPQKEAMGQLLEKNMGQHASKPCIASAKKPTPSEFQKNLCSHLKAKQEKKYQHYKKSRSIYLAAGIGLTLIAVASIPGVNAAVLIVGITIAAIAGAAKLYEVIQASRKSQKTHRIFDTEKKRILNQGLREIEPAKGLSGEESIAYRLHQKARPALTETAFQQELRNLSPAQQSRFMTCSFNRYVQNTLLGEHLGNSEAEEAFSEHDKNQMLSSLLAKKAAPKERSEKRNPSDSQEMRCVV